jgi:NAD(P)H-dependent flavin oxidoreductase YrpB (nitropropane dioxygenase family)
MIKTRFQEIFGTKYPIIQAGMGPYNTERLATAVAKVGGLGLISTVGMGSFELPGLGHYRYSAIFRDAPPAELVTQSIDFVLENLKDFPDAKFGVNIPVSEEFIPTASEIIHTVIDLCKSHPDVQKKLKAIVTSAGDPLPWAIDPQGKALKTSIAIKRELPHLVWCHVVPSVRAAKRVERAGADVVIASGREGGAHCSWRDVSSMVLIPEVVKNVKLPVVAAGGFADGLSLTAALAMGAIGVQMGTRFIATKESDFEQVWKEGLTKATEEDTLVARGFFGPMRFLRNKRALELVNATLKGAPDLYRGIPTGSSNEIINLEVDGLNNLFKGDYDNTPILGGAVAGRIHDIPTVAELLTRIMKETESRIRQINAYVVKD